MLDRVEFELELWTSQEAMENFVFPDKILTKCMN